VPAKDRTKRRATPHQERARASVDAILTAAALVLRDEGFARATTNRIATRAGVNVALVYRYFAGKEAIVGALIERAAEATYEAVRAALTDDPKAPLATTLRAMLTALVDTPGLDPAVHRELVEHVDIARRRKVVHELRARAGALFSEFLEHRAELRSLADRDAFLFVLQHAIESAAHAVAFYRPDGLSPARALDALVELSLRALVPIRDPRRRTPR
jgi:AcrR family transcriptional regulator